ncbi:MAG: penicillin-binding transpeptidase domain-containing protein [Sodaliphilus sp.]
MTKSSNIKTSKTNKGRILWRYTLVVLGLLGFSILITARLFKTTVIHARDWNIKADSVWLDTVTLYGERGRILADDGSVLAANMYFSQAMIDWKCDGFKDSIFYNHLDALCDSLESFDASKTKEEWKEELKKAKEAKRRNYKLFGDSLLTHTEYTRVKKFPVFTNDYFVMLYETRKRRRNKPYGSMASRSIGNVIEPPTKYHTYLNWKDKNFNESQFRRLLPALADSLQALYPKTNASEWRNRLSKGCKEKSESFAFIPHPVSEDTIALLRKCPFIRNHKSMFVIKKVKDVGGQHGSSGLEKALDSLLFGVPVRAPKVALNINTTNYGAKPLPGYDVTTTINIGLQEIVETELLKKLTEAKSDWGCALLMEVSTGEIKAISNFDYDPKTDSYKEGVNHAVLRYEPGSVLKTINLMVALEDGIISNLDQEFEIGSEFRPAKGVLVAEEHPSKTACVRKILARSLNVGMAKIMWRKYGSNPHGLQLRLNEMGFFEPFNSGIAGEMPPRYNRVGLNSQGLQNFVNQCYGYCAVMSPLYVAGIYNAWANNGKFVRPHLVKKLSREGEADSIVPITYIREQVCSPENAAKLRELLYGVVHIPGGTAYCLRDCEVPLAGKTGTAKASEGKKGYSNKKRYTFCGFFPYDKPMYTCIVLIYGGATSAPAGSGRVMANIAEKMRARGLLGNASDYERSITHEAGDTEAPMYVAASDKSSRHAYIKKAVGNTRGKFCSRPPAGKGVPNVTGLNLRDAVARLEKLGLRVHCEGVGVVVAQSVAPGSAVHRGTSIKLTLSNNPKMK